MSPEALARGLPGLAALALIGRVALSLCPPGLPGTHKGGGAAATWAASHAFGLAAVGAQAALAALFDLPLSPISLLAPWLAVAVVRWALLPGAMVARREPRREPAGAWTAAARIALACALLLPLLGLVEVSEAAAPAQADGSAEPEPPMLLAGAGLVARLGGGDAEDAVAVLSVASLAALALLLLHGLAAARRAPLGRTAVALALVATPGLQLAAMSGSRDVALALLFGAGAALMVPWLRRADRRAGALAAVAFAACAACAASGWPLALAGLVALVACTHRVERLFVAGWSAGSMGVLALPWLALLARESGSESAVVADRMEELRACASELADAGRWGILWIASAIVLALALGGMRGGLWRRGARPATAGVGEPERAQLLSALAALAIAAQILLQPAVAGAACSGGLAALAPVAALAAGLVLVRSERPV
ncbi:MAG TPA: hypothetical protein VMS76_13665 [Planctomycetota bacterium]|nr:hypothetical protein [Planctomycetota bacterium]